AAQTVAAMSLVDDTVRARRGPDFINSFSARPIDVAGFFAPGMPGRNEYLGWIAMLLTGVALVARPVGRNLALAGVIVVAVLCSLGEHLPVLVWLAKVVPPFGLFRGAQVYAYALIVPLGLLAADGLGLLLC